MAINPHHVPTEAGVFCTQRVDVHDVFDQAINLQAIAIHDGNHVIEVEVSGLHRCFPNLAFLLLAVAHDAEDLVLLFIESRRQGESHCNAQPLAKRSRGGFNPRQLQPVRMALIGRTQLAQRDHVVDRAKSRECESQI